MTIAGIPRFLRTLPRRDQPDSGTHQASASEQGCSSVIWRRAACASSATRLSAWSISTGRWIKRADSSNLRGRPQRHGRVGDPSAHADVGDPSAHRRARHAGPARRGRSAGIHRRGASHEHHGRRRQVGGIEANRSQTASFLYDNLSIAANVIDAAYNAGVPRLLYLGSSCIYPWLAPQPMPEEALQPARWTTTTATPSPRSPAAAPAGDRCATFHADEILNVDWRHSAEMRKEMLQKWPCLTHVVHDNRNLVSLFSLPP